MGLGRPGSDGALAAAARPWRALYQQYSHSVRRWRPHQQQQQQEVSAPLHAAATPAVRRRPPQPACRSGAPERPPALEQLQEETEQEDGRQPHNGVTPPPPVNGRSRVAGGLFGAFADPEAAVAPRPPPPAGAPIEPDLVLAPPPGGGPIYVFGCVHADSDSPHMAQFILEKRPHAVVVETAVNPWHGSATGNVLRREEALRSHTDHRTRSWAQLGVQLAEAGAPSPPPAQQQQQHQPGAAAGAAAFPLWHDLSGGRNRLWSEHLAYVAAFAVGAELVFGDRPKRVTYHRLLWCPSLEDLDAAYGMQSALNYHELVSTLRPFNDVGNTNCVHRVLILERDATLLHALHGASLRAGPGGCVVGVVGASHLAGMRHLWEAGRWRELLGDGEALCMPDIEAVRAREPAERLGVRWALFRAVLRLTCRPDVIRDVRSVVGPVPPELRGVYCLAAELYGSSRMLLAVLNRDQLAEVCSGWCCDFYDVLGPLRAVRPVNGGPGYDEELVLALRALQFEIDHP